MSESETLPSVTEQTRSWIAWLFGVSDNSLQPSTKIGVELQPSTRSFYGNETFAVFTEDLVDIEKTLKREVSLLDRGVTVGDFCTLVEDLDRANPLACQRLLRSWKKLVSLDSKPKWRKAIFKTIGI